MANRSALVTGGNRGIGLAACRRLAQLGMTVYLGSRQLTDGQRVAKQLQSEGLSVVAVELDVADPASVTACFTGLEEQRIGIDVLVNNAGVYSTTVITRASEEEMEEALQVNLVGPWRVAKLALKHMQAKGYGRIVNITSGYGQMSQSGGPGAGAYGLSKAALNALTMQLAKAVSGDIKINALDPGWVATRMGGSGAPTQPSQVADEIARLATLPAGGPTGALFWNGQRIEW